DVFRLVRTMVIKIEAIALRDNKVLEEAGYPVGLDKRTWRYYMTERDGRNALSNIKIQLAFDHGASAPMLLHTNSTQPPTGQG
ncbi:hypothetical protein, partial [Pseudomonas aeruginosa]|uniref:hypothetical protein n=1 Tax=Pseudomonas aeruginosa TaxID=287 RepID=UPI0011697ACD